MNIEITDLEMILNYLETTSLEPHDDYSSEFTYKDQKILYNYIKQLQQENVKLKQQLKDKDEKISKVIEYCLNEREDINGSKCDDILEILESNIQDLKKLKYQIII
jgi:hypothetical protein